MDHKSFWFEHGSIPTHCAFEYSTLAKSLPVLWRNDTDLLFKQGLKGI
jgi:hypothetical protein